MNIDGKAIADEILEGYKEQILALEGRAPSLTVILIGEDPASQVYVNLKTKACAKVGITSQKLQYPDTITQNELLKLVEELNHNPEVDGILVQMPLPKHIDATTITQTIDPNKDVDGFHPINTGKLWSGDPTGFIPCTPLGVMELLAHEGIDPKGKEVVIVGRSNIVGKPMAALLLAKHATVTFVHSRTKSLAKHCQSADILIAAAGKPNLIDGSMIKPGAIVIDVGVNKIVDRQAKKGYRLVGDVEYDTAKEHASKITPVPGGVGPMTIAMLLYNTIRSYKIRCDESLP